MDFLSGSDVSLEVVFQTKDRTFVPDSGSAKLNLRGHDGSLLITNQAITVAPGANRATVVIASGSNTLAVGQKFAKRTAHISYTVSGQSYDQFISYRLIPWLNHSMTPEKVRYYLGANFNDVPDDAIDLVNAYYKVEELLADSSVVLNDKLIASGMDEVYANDAIGCFAALTILPSLRLAAAQQEENGAISFRRYADVDWDALEEALRSRMGSAIEVLTNTEQPASTLLVFTTRTDPVTGA